jgi:succinate dehydrogenase / fumarate reductase flavoprotein subunit
MAAPRIIVVGGGLAGLAAVIKIAEAGGTVDLFSIVPVKRSHSVCAQGGINAAKNLKGEGDTTDKHFDDTIYGGDFLANQTPVKAMCEAAPAIIDLLDRMGVPFNRTPEGLLDFPPLRRHALQPHRLCRRNHRAAVALRARRAGAPLRVRRQGEEVRGLGVSLRRHRLQGRGARHHRARPAHHGAAQLRADAIILATGGIGAIFGKSTNSVVCTGSAQSAVFQQGAYYANGEFIQVHPTAFPAKTSCG